MSGIILQTTAIAIVNKGGGHQTKTQIHEWKDELNGVHHQKERKITKEKVPGCDYVVFKCPWDDCRQRNKQSMYRVKGVVGNSLSFSCNKCRREIEVSKPAPKPQNIVVPGINTPKHFELFGPDNRPIR
jgi:hypothetical protein